MNATPISSLVWTDPEAFSAAKSAEMETARSQLQVELQKKRTEASAKLDAELAADRDALARERAETRIAQRDADKPHRDIVEILSDVRDIIDPYVMQLTTNGMLTKRTIEALHKVAWPGLQLRISVDGLEKTHDRMRGVEGSWATVTRTVREVAELKEQYGFKFGINFAVTDDSIHEFDEMVEYAASVGALHCEVGLALNTP